LQIPFNLLLEKGEIKMKIFLISPRPLMGEGKGERVKECKRRLECNRPLSLTLSHARDRGKNKSHCFPFFYFLFYFPSFLKIGDFIYVKKSKAKKFTLYFIKTCYH